MLTTNQEMITQPILLTGFGKLIKMVLMEQQTLHLQLRSQKQEH